MNVSPEEVAAAAKVAPPATIGALTFAGVDLSQWVLLATLVYTLLQITFLIRDRIYRKRKN